MLKRKVKKRRVRGINFLTRGKPRKKTYREKRNVTQKKYRMLRSRNIHKKAFQLGKIAAKEMMIQQQINEDQLRDMNRRWNHWFKINRYSKLPWNEYLQTCNYFFRGVASETNTGPLKYLLLPTDKSVSAIVTAMNEEHTISKVFSQLKRMPLHETIIVINGSQDSTFEQVRKDSNAVILHFNEPLGHDVGRALGAKISRSEILLFLDGDIPIQAEELIPFIHAIDKGFDVALNNITPYLQSFNNRDGVTVVKELLNRVLGRADLGANSLTAIPHALSRKAAEIIGYSNLIVPPKAQAIAIREGLNVGAPAGVNVVTNNRIRKTNVGVQNPVAEMIVGDHIEAIHFIANQENARMAYPDEFRKRSYISE